MRRLGSGFAAVALIAASTAATPALAGPSGVAFVSIRTGDPQIYVRNAAGEIVAVTEGKGLPAQPAWASNGRLAYAARVGFATRIFVTDEKGRAPRRLTSDDRSEISPSFSPDGRAVAYFSRPLEGGSTELRVVDLDTMSSSTLARDEREMGPTAPSWSADGSRLAFGAIYNHERSHGYVVRRDGGGLRNITEKHSPRGAEWPSLSPDGRQLLWIANMRERQPVVVTDIDRGESRELTTARIVNAESPRWSPDGRQVVFASMTDSVGAGGRNDIFVMDADGSNLRNLTRHPGEDFDPKWSADGRSIVFVSLRSGTSLLYEVDLDNGSTRPVSEHASHDMDHVTRPLAAAR